MNPKKGMGKKKRDVRLKRDDKHCATGESWEGKERLPEKRANMKRGLRGGWAPTVYTQKDCVTGGKNMDMNFLANQKSGG